MELLTTITFFIGIGLFIWGYLVAFENALHLVPDHYIRGSINSAGFTKWTGYNLIVTGILGLVDGLLQYLAPATHIVMGGAYFFVIVPIMTIKIIRGMRKFRNKE